MVQAAVSLAVNEGVASTQGLRPTSSWERAGQYISFPKARGVGARFGTDLRLWREYGRTPVWVTFSPGDWGRAPEVCALLDPWASRIGVTSVTDSEGFSVGVDLPTGKEMDHVVRAVTDRLRDIAEELRGLGSREER
ncbi:hypothetical protein ACFLWA_04755 [Chloroflexota bacterium]